MISRLKITKAIRKHPDYYLELFKEALNDWSKNSNSQKIKKDNYEIIFNDRIILNKSFSEIDIIIHNSRKSEIANKCFRILERYLKASHNFLYEKYRYKHNEQHNS